MFDAVRHAGSPTTVCSALGGRELQRLVHRAPHLLGCLAGVERLAGGATAERAHDLGVGPDAGIPGAELTLHTLPELAVSHERRLGGADGDVGRDGGN